MQGVSWEAVGVFVTIMMFFGGILVAIIKALLAQYQKHLDERFKSLEEATRERNDRVTALQKELLEFKAYAEREYVHHEYWVRMEGGQTIMLRNMQDQIHELKVFLHASKHQLAEGAPRGDAR